MLNHLAHRNTVCQIKRPELVRELLQVFAPHELIGERELPTNSGI